MKGDPLAILALKYMYISGNVIPYLHTVIGETVFKRVNTLQVPVQILLYYLYHQKYQKVLRVVYHEI